MNWKGIFVGAIATLVVTILAGLLVYYVTKEPSAPEPSEELVYSVDPPVVFKTEERTIVLLSARVSNVGRLAARDVLVSAEFDDLTAIVDADIGMSSEPAGVYNVRVPKVNLMEISIPVLAPEESVLITYLLDRAPLAEPFFAVKSSSTLGRLDLFPSIEVAPAKSDIERASVVLVPILAVAPIPFVYFMLRRLLLSRRFRNVNNSAFLFIHKGMTNVATEMLTKQIETRGGDSYLFSNLAVCRGLSGDYDNAERLMGMAEIAAISKHSKAVVAFNRSLISLMTEDINSGLSYLGQALELSRKQILNYCSFSVLIAIYRKEIDELDALLRA